MKTHFKILGVDCRNMGQTEREYNNQVACGYAREKNSTNGDDVDCFYCLRSKHMEHYHRINKTLSDSSGYY